MVIICFGCESLYQTVLICEKLFRNFVQAPTESPDIHHCVCLPGVRRVGDGSHTLLFRHWEGNSKFIAKCIENKKARTLFNCSFLPFLFQCPFYDEYIVSLHNKIKNKPVEFPET